MSKSQIRLTRIGTPVKPLTAKNRLIIEEEELPIRKPSTIGKGRESYNENVNLSVITEDYSINK
jgi:hypothetical protein